MKKTAGSIVATLLVALAPSWGAQGDGNLDDYLVDVSPAPVSAATIVGLDPSSIIDVQSAKDLVLAVNPFSTNGSKDGYALVFTPARSGILPLAMAGRTYRNGGIPARMLGALTLSYAESKAELGGVDYRKNALALESSFYIDENQDPIVIGSKAFTECGEGRRAAERKLLDLFRKLGDAKTEAERAAIQADIDATKVKVTELSGKSDCLAPAKWNAHKVSFSYGAGWIKPTSNSTGRLSLGKSFVASALLGFGADSAFHVALKRTTDEIDTTTISSSTPDYKSSNLVGVRFTKGESGLGTKDLRLLAEVSNAKKTKATLSNAAFMYALGADKKVADGLWLQFRVGRSRTIDNTSTQTTSLLSFNWSPSSTLFKQ